MITALTIADSLCHNGARLTTMALTFPRMLLPEFNTHRQFSRNAASSRAIPVKQLLDKASYVPKNILSNRAGMQGGEPLSATKELLAKATWIVGMEAAKLTTKMLGKLGVHKQWANRPIEPYLYVTVLVTATDWANFLKQRLSPGAQPEMQELAQAVQWQLVTSKPEFLTEAQYHLPYVTDEEKATLHIETQKLVSVARCARVSYLNHDRTSPSVEKDLALAYKLLFPESGPMHASPWEHVARPTDEVGQRPAKYNLRGWQSMRYALDNFWNGPTGLQEFWENFQYVETEQMLPC